MNYFVLCTLNEKIKDLLVKAATDRSEWREGVCKLVIGYWDISHDLMDFMAPPIQYNKNEIITWKLTSHDR